MDELKKIEDKKAILIALGLRWLVIGFIGMFIGLKEQGFSLGFIINYWAMWIGIFATVGYVVILIVRSSQRGGLMNKKQFSNKKNHKNV